MTFITPPEKEGDTKKCPTCGLELVGRLTDYKGRYPDKKQWQNKGSRKAHYDKDGNCKDSTVNTENTAPAPTNIDNTSNLPEMDPGTCNHVDKQIIFIRQIEARVFSVLGKDANVAKVGMYVKLILEGINGK